MESATTRTWVGRGREGDGLDGPSTGAAVEEGREGGRGDRKGKGWNRKVLAFLPPPLVPPSTLTISELQLLPTAFSFQQKKKQNKKTTKRSPLRTRSSFDAATAVTRATNASTVYLRLSWSPCEKTVEYIVERLTMNEDENFNDNWFLCYRGPAPLCVLRLQRPDGYNRNRNEHRHEEDNAGSEIKFRIIAVDVEGIASAPSIAFRHFIEEKRSSRKGETISTSKMKKIFNRKKHEKHGVSRQVRKVYQRAS